MTTLNDAKRYIASHIVEGCVCPCCGQNVKLYKQKLTKPMIEGLALLYQIAQARPFPDDYIHTPSEFLKLGMSATERNLARLRHWNLVESAAAGMWRLTETGKLFLQGIVPMPHRVYLFNGKCYGIDETEVLTVWDVMGLTFDINKGE